MAGKLCATPITAGISTFAAVLAYYWPKPYTFPCVIIFGGLLTLLWSKIRKETLPPPKVGALGAWRRQVQVFHLGWFIRDRHAA